MANGQDHANKQIFVSVCIFKTEKHSEWKRGVAIGSDPSDIWAIVDTKFKPLQTSPWDYRIFADEGCFWTTK